MDQRRGRLAEDHPPRELDKALYLGFVHEEVASFYRRRSYALIDAVVLWRLPLSYPYPVHVEKNTSLDEPWQSTGHVGCRRGGMVGNVGRYPR